MPLLSLSHVSVRSKTTTLLEDVSLQVFAEQLLTVVGPNGAGKSTLVKVALGLCSIQSGQVGHAKGLRIGYVPQQLQQIQQLPMRVSRFLALHPNHTLENAKKASDLAGVPQSLANRFITQLSVGELKRVLLARALLQIPHLLVLDEPDAGLDLKSQLKLYDLLETLQNEQKVGILLISHELHWVLAKSNRAICLSKRVCCQGAPEVIRADPAFLKHFPTIQSSLRAF